jgi:hypothetical protein
VESGGERATIPYYWKSLDWARLAADFPPPPNLVRISGRRSADELRAFQSRLFLERVAEGWKTPSAGERHINLLVQKYTRVVDRALKEGQIRPLSTLERDVLIYMMMGARDYLSKYIARSRSNREAEPKRIVDAYMSILRSGVRDDKTSQINEAPGTTTEAEARQTPAERGVTLQRPAHSQLGG